jgi:hypothetical protein
MAPAGIAAVPGEEIVSVILAFFGMDRPRSVAKNTGNERANK